MISKDPSASLNAKHFVPSQDDIRGVAIAKLSKEMDTMKGTLRIDITALQNNYDIVKAHVGASCEVSAVVKADGYSCGIEHVGRALQARGCQTFFVATLQEALNLRVAIDDQAVIGVFNGFWAQEGDAYAAHSITPVLNSLHEIKAYQALAKTKSKHLSAMIHIDTAMNRLGLEASDLQILRDDPGMLNGLDILYIMSHFASADDPHAGSDTNAKQNAKFLKACEMLPAALSGAKQSLANAPGLFRNNAYHYDMVRPGLCLYGLNPLPDKENIMKPVIALDVPILQIRHAYKGESCGYNETYRFEKDTRLAIVSAGYADGLLRSLSNRGKLYYKGYPCPIRGRVSMDLITVDLCHLPDHDTPKIGAMMEVIGTHQSIEALAKDAGTITHELLTSIGNRYTREYSKSFKAS